MRSVSGGDDGIAATDSHTSNISAGRSIAAKQFEPIAPVVLENGCAKNVMVCIWRM